MDEYDSFGDMKDWKWQEADVGHRSDFFDGMEDYDSFGDIKFPKWQEAGVGHKSDFFDDMDDFTSYGDMKLSEVAKKESETRRRYRKDDRRRKDGAKRGSIESEAGVGHKSDFFDDMDDFTSYG